MEQIITEALEEYGLSENEIKVYVTLLKIGECSAQLIAKNANLPRTTVYHLLDSLSQRGLISSLIKEHIRYFQATEPKRIIDLLDDKKKLMEKALPILHSLSGTIKEKPDVTIFEGLKGIKVVLQEVLKEKKRIYHYGDIYSLQNVLPYAFPQYIQQRVEKKISIRVICKREEPHNELLKTSKKEYREFVFVPDNYSFKTSLFIFADKVAIFNLQKEPYYVIVVTNKDFYDTQKNMFELLWKLLKK